MACTATDLTLADLLQRFGPIPAARIRYDLPPGTATEQDVVTLEAREARLFELIDGILVEKAVGFYESFLAIRLARFLSEFVERHHLGIVAGADGMLRLAPGLVRIPDVSFIPWSRLPQRQIPRQPIPDLVLDHVIRGENIRLTTLDFNDRTTANVIATIGNDSHHRTTETTQIERLRPEHSRHHQIDQARQQEPTHTTPHSL